MHDPHIIRLSTPVRHCSSGGVLGFARPGPSPPYGHIAAPTSRRLSLGGARPFQLSPQGSYAINLHSFKLPPKLLLCDPLKLNLLISLYYKSLICVRYLIQRLLLKNEELKFLNT